MIRKLEHLSLSLYKNNRGLVARYTRARFTLVTRPISVPPLRAGGVENQNAARRKAKQKDKRQWYKHLCNKASEKAQPKILTALEERYSCIVIIQNTKFLIKRKDSGKNPFLDRPGRKQSKRETPSSIVPRQPDPKMAVGSCWCGV